jgi:hypothetical protein
LLGFISVLLFPNEQSEMPPERQSLFVSHRHRRWFTLKELLFAIFNHAIIAMTYLVSVAKLHLGRNPGGSQLLGIEFCNRNYPVSSMRSSPKRIVPIGSVEPGKTRGSVESRQPTQEQS